MSTKLPKEVGAAIGVKITPPRMDTITFSIRGTAPYVQLAFSKEVEKERAEKMATGSQAKRGKARPLRNYEQEFRRAQHFSENGKNGIPAMAFRIALISACRLVDFKMTLAKLSVFIKADDYEADGTGLVPINGEPQMIRNHVRNSGGTSDLRVRAKFWPWSATVHVSYDAEQFSADDIANLMHRAGLQVGIGEGRPDAKNSGSAGMGWGTFEIVNE
jgi:hypothetical protein